MTLADLHDAQIGWRRVQCDGLRTYFDAKGIAHDGVRGDWPLIPYAVTDEAPRDSNFCDPWRDEEAPF
jgi:hypothetical protein